MPASLSCRHVVGIVGFLITMSMVLTNRFALNCKGLRRKVKRNQIKTSSTTHSQYTLGEPTACDRLRPPATACDP